MTWSREQSEQVPGRVRAIRGGTRWRALDGGRAAMSELFSDVNLSLFTGLRVFEVMLAGR